MIRVGLLTIALVLGGGLVAAPVVEACGFEHQEFIGPIEWGLKCTRPYVVVHTDEIWPVLP